MMALNPFVYLAGPIAHPNNGRNGIPVPIYAVFPDCHWCVERVFDAY